mmetsp:Transcript_1523/g.3441  ORF Transcript_1523/g.3441 Transcript_1523/m.3441 type:complete len:253 (-) Transcript_1523:328-1086(-)
MLVHAWPDRAMGLSKPLTWGWSHFMVSVLRMAISGEGISPLTPANTSTLVRPVTQAVCPYEGDSVRAVFGFSHCIVSMLSTATSLPTASCWGAVDLLMPPYITSSFPLPSADRLLQSRSRGTSPLRRACEIWISQGSSNKILSSVVALDLSVSSSIWPFAFSSAASLSSICRLSALSSSLCFSMRSCCLRTASSRVSLSRSRADASSSLMACAAFCSFRDLISSMNFRMSVSSFSTCCWIDLSLTSSALICS